MQHSIRQTWSEGGAQEIMKRNHFSFRENRGCAILGTES